MNFKGGRLQQKLPEDGAPPVEDKNKKPAPPKGKEAKLEELSPEEEARLKEEKEKMELQNTERQAEWNAMTSDEQFYSYSED